MYSTVLGIEAMHSTRWNVAKMHCTARGVECSYNALHSARYRSRDGEDRGG